MRVAASSALVAAHGQALALTPFLPTEEGRSGVLELLPSPPTVNGGRSEMKPPFFHTYPTLSQTLGVRHIQCRAALSPPCEPAALARGAPQERWLRCNLTANVAATVAGVGVLANIARGRRQPVVRPSRVCKLMKP